VLVTLFEKPAHRRLGDRHERDDVHRDRLDVEVQPQVVIVVSRAGADHDEVDRTRLFECARDLGHRIRMADVDASNDDLRPQRVTGRFQSIDPPRHQHQLPTVAVQFAGKRFADAR
jgi:hypothetical protein